MGNKGRGPNEVVISEHNSKMGDIPSVSLPPVKACGNSLLCRKKCYAKRPYKMYPNTRRSWDQNLRLFALDGAYYFTSINDYLVNKSSPIRKPKVPFTMFRWHVSGDIINQPYMEGIALTADMFPKINFLCFTKMYHVVDNHIRGYDALSSNLQVVLSAWPGLELFNPWDLPVAWVDDGTEDRIPDSAVMCAGNCDTCGSCWDLSNRGHDVYFKLH